MINALPRDLLTSLIFNRLTLYELGYVARVCKLWHRLQNEAPLNDYKTSVLLTHPEVEGELIETSFKTRCIQRLFAGLPILENLNLISNRLYVGQNSLLLPYMGRHYVMTIDPLFITSQSRMHGIVRCGKEIHFYCTAPKIVTRRRIFGFFRLIPGIYKEEIPPNKSIHEQLKAVGAFPIAVEAKRSWNNISLTYYLLALSTPFILLTKGLDLIAIFSTASIQTPSGYEKQGKFDLYQFKREVLRIESIECSMAIKITQKKQLIIY